ncbi:unnamed protein product [Prunus brigantina]
MKCSADIATRTKEILDERLYDFLAGLDHHLDRIRGQVLAEDPLPSVQAAYAQVCSEANRQATMLAGSHVDGSAMTTTLHRPAPSSGHPRPGQKEPDTRQCTHCGKKKHTRETCFELVGYPDWWVDKLNKEKEKKKSVANLTAQLTSTSSPHPGTSHYGFAMSTPFSASDKLWIIDSGAFDHMTNNNACFVSHSHPYTKTVKVANGLSTPVLGAGSVSLTPSLSLSSVLHDLQTKEQIGHGKESGGLYYLDSKPPDPQIKSGYQVSTEKAEAEIWLWHKRLGHPSFQYLQILFPSLFAKVHVSDFHCETCIFAKMARSLCFAMHVPKRFWGDAICTAVYLINRVPSRVLRYRTPIRTLSRYHSIPSLLHIQPKVFGCVSYVHVHQHSRDKLDPRALKCVFVGYSISQKGYKCYYPPSGKIFVSMDVTFVSKRPIFRSLLVGGRLMERKSRFPDIGYIPSPNDDTHDTHEKELQVYQERRRNEGVTDSLLPDHVPDQPRYFA